ncbi:unnamed protein product [Urochloa decumbens]|uniref:Uncharacterized protein n=1 Tax=Urochloa decumbens TaxID=240449 RepID=A0ABC9B8C8_9POAL
MAAVLDALVPYVKQKIKDKAVQELGMLMGVSGEISKLGDTAYVADAERRRIDDAMVQGWVSKIKGALYEATDVVELCKLDAEERRRHEERGLWRCWAAMEEVAPDFIRQVLFCLRNPGFAYDTGSRIKGLNARLDGIRKEMADFRFEPLGRFRRPPGDADAATIINRTTTSLLDDSAIVGDAVQAEANSLVQLLLTGGGGGGGTVVVVSIVGVGGVGKTTLAQKIYNDRAIQAAFRRKIWLAVTENYTEEKAGKLLNTAITQAGGEPPRGGDKQVLSQALADVLSVVGKFLLVMDDVWSERPWTDVLKIPVLQAARSNPGSMVIVTTRKEHIAKDMGLGATYHQHRVRPMRDGDAWSLLKKQLPPQDVGSDSDLDHLKHIGMQIVRNCDGLPLAIKAIGGLLRTKKATKRQWTDVLDDPTWKTDKTHHDLNIALCLSYEDLSPELKQCFLYCSLFPKGHSIQQGIVIGMWMSEGFLKLPPNSEAGLKELEDIGMDYYKDLMTRNLIEPDDKFRDRSLCKMHDVIHSFAQYMAKEEALVVGQGQISSLVDSSQKFRRLWVESAESEVEYTALKQELLRSLIINARMKFGANTGDYSLSKFPSLRALFVIHAESDRFVESLGKLKHLRYLRLENTDITRLPDDIDKMKLLEHISICNCTMFTGQIPISILKLEHLRHLAIGAGTKFTVPKGFGGLTNLRTLAPFPAQRDGEWCSVQELGPLSRLRTLELGRLEAVPSGSMAAEAMICNKDHLRVLVLMCYDKSGGGEAAGTVLKEDDIQRIEEVFDQLCPPLQLETLKISNYFGRRLPIWMCMPTAMDMDSLTGLELIGISLCTQLPDGLGRLRSLEVLIVDFALAIRRVGPEFQRHSAGSTSSTRPSSSFPRLHFLKFSRLPEWEEWEWEEEAQGGGTIAMPVLDTITIIECKLDLLPPGLASSTRVHLRELYLIDVGRITILENFPSVLSLSVKLCPGLKTVRGFPRLQTAYFESCPALEVLEVNPALDTLDVGDPAMETLPEYMRGLKPRILGLFGLHQKLRDLLLLANSNDPLAEYRAEMDKIKHCGKLLIYDGRIK